MNPAPAATLANPSLTPFPLNAALEISALDFDSRLRTTAEPKAHDEDGPPSPIDHLPGYPSVGLAVPEVHAHLRRELATPVIDELYHVLWVFSVKSGRNIDPLHNQRIKGREIVPTERVKLHLVWTKDKIYIKTLPICLVNRTVWDVFLGADTQAPGAAAHAIDRGAALGFLRSYALLIQSPLDFALAKEARLIPEGVDVDWIRWERFMLHFRNIQDGQVSKRYRYGQIRLNRLNWMLRFMQPKSSQSIWFYQRHTWSVGAMIGEFLPVLLFAFASMSLALSSMQVTLAIPVEDLGFARLDGQSVVAMQRAFWLFSIANIFVAGLIWVYLITLPLAIFFVQVCWALRHKGSAEPPSRIKSSAIHGYTKG